MALVLFRFQNMWCTHVGFKPFVEAILRELVSSSGLCKLAEKLRKVKVALKVWNINVFGHVSQNIKALNERLEMLESQLENNYNEKIECEYLITKTELEIWENREEIRMSQLAKKQMVEGR